MGEAADLRALRELNERQRGFVLAAMIAGRPWSPGRSRLAEPWKTRCGSALALLGDLSRAERIAQVERLGREVLSPLCGARSTAHPSWIAKQLRGQPGEFVDAVASLLPAEMRAGLLASRAAGPARSTAPTMPVALRLRLAVRILGALQEMPGPGLDPRPDGWDIAGWPAERLAGAVEQLGLMALAAVLGRAGPDYRARLSQALSPKLRRSLRALEGVELPPTVLRHALDGGLPASREIAWEMGARLVGSGLAGRVARSIAQRLPETRGRAIAEAIAGAAKDAGDGELVAALRLADRRLRGASGARGDR